MANLPQSISIRDVAAMLFCIGAIVAGLVYGQSFLVPIVIALFIASLIGALVDQLRRIGIPGWLGMIIALGLLAVTVGIVVDILTEQAKAVADAWPRYVDRLRQLSAQFAQWVGPNIVQRMQAWVQDVEIANSIPKFAGSVGGIITMFALVFVYVGFMLAERRQLQSKISRMFSDKEYAGQALAILDGISESMRHYLWVKTLLGILTGGVSYAVLKWLAVDFAETWALLIFLLSFIPSIGSVLGVIFPAVLALLQFDTLWQFAVIAVLLSVFQMFIGNVLEPAFMGRTLNLSPFVVMASLVFWASVWGIVGAFLSVPLTAALVIICSYMPNCRWIAVLLSDDGQVAHFRSDSGPDSGPDSGSTPDVAAHV